MVGHTCNPELKRIRLGRRRTSLRLAWDTEGVREQSELHSMTLSQNQTTKSKPEKKVPFTQERWIWNSVMGACGMALQVKVLAANSDNLSSIPSIYPAGEENQLL